MNTQVIVIEKTMLSKHCLIFCPVCETTTKHVLSRSGEFYMCSTKDCNSIVDIENPVEEEIEDETI
jgi:ssDNA-binding Zn-finger/Zn-ribbon topoisomerase 1